MTSAHPASLPQAYISFDPEHDDDLRLRLELQSLRPDSPFRMLAGSSRGGWNQLNWEAVTLAQLNRVDFVVVLVGEFTSQSSIVLSEIRLAKSVGIPLFGLNGRLTKDCPTPTGLATAYAWTWENLRLLIASLR